MFFIVRRLFKCDWLACAAAGMLAMTPAHFILSRYALDYLYPLPFLLGWLLPHGAVEIPSILLAGQAGADLVTTVGADDHGAGAEDNQDDAGGDAAVAK